MTSPQISPDDEAALRAAWRIYGRDMQIDICIEEMAELTHALLHTRRSGAHWSYAVIEEVADVSICLQQIEMQLRGLPRFDEPGTLWDRVEEIRTTKITRLMDRLQAEIHLRHEEEEEVD